MRLWRGPLWMALTLLLVAQVAAGGNILVSQPDPFAGYGYGLPEWDNFSAALDTATGGNVDVTGELDDLALMLQYEGILLVERQHSTPDQLTALEESNLAAYLDTGNRAILVGEDADWSGWNAEILSLVGSTFAGNTGGLASAITVHQITDNAPEVGVFGFHGAAALTPDATPLYDLDFVTLWGAQQNALTLLTITAISDLSWNGADNGQFGTNVAVWLANPAEAAIPEPASLGLLGIGVLTVLRRRRHS